MEPLERSGVDDMLWKFLFCLAYPGNQQSPDGASGTVDELICCVEEVAVLSNVSRQPTVTWWSLWNGSWDPQRLAWSCTWASLRPRREWRGQRTRPTASRRSCSPTPAGRTPSSWTTTRLASKVWGRTARSVDTSEWLVWLAVLTVGHIMFEGKQHVQFTQVNG